ncbi:MAG: sugar phosphate isomerase/epimerase [Bacteroidaceae bacterium]|nr:sugar phosphate isomerase/epimerase [Bacteroidaceae bacterium]
MDRRDFIKSASILSLGALAGCGNSKETATAAAAAAPAAGNKQLGLQIYTLGPELYNGDLAANFQKLASFGVKKLELAGYDPKDRKIGGVELMEFKEKAEAAGLTIVSSHVNPPALFGGAAGKETRDGSDGQFNADKKAAIVEQFKTISEDHAKLGCQFLIQPMMPVVGVNTEDECKAFAEILNATGESVKSFGMQFGYHNHNMEYCMTGTERKMGDIFTRPREGKMLIDVFMENTAPENVCLEMDIYWTIMGQNDPVEMLTKYANRIKALHIKDRCVLGDSGMINYKNIFEKFYANGLEHYFIEIEDTTSGKQMERLEASCKFLNSCDFVK